MSSRAKLAKKRPVRAVKKTVRAVNEKSFGFAPHITKILKSRKWSPEAEARLLEDPAPLVIAGLLHTFIEVFNPLIPPLFTTVNINAFGLSDNHLDPLSFNGKVRASASGDACLPQECGDIFGLGEICTPTICAGGEARASLDTLRGLSGLQIRNFSVTRFSQSKSSIRTANTDLMLFAPIIVGDGSAGASGGPFGISIPVSASVTAFMLSPIATLKSRITFDTRPPKLLAFKLESLNIGGGTSGLQIRLNGLGPFDSIGDQVVSILQTQIAPLIVGDGTISDAAKNLLQDKINDYIKNQG
ncbi:MAG TPA: hypothetical protein VGC87_19730 [Pyrinomonadaceae bacterium]|jgi:hypothetical protein